MMLYIKSIGMKSKNEFFVKFLLLVIFPLGMLSSCSQGVPKTYEEASEQLSIYPDYQDVVVPINIAPMNFMVLNENEGVCVVVKNETGEELLVEEGDGKVIFDESGWRKIISENEQLEFSVFAQKKTEWVRYKPFKMTVVKDSIDPYVTCRLIEPSYENIGNSGLFQFGLEDLSFRKLNGNAKYWGEANRERSVYCMNCHTTQASNPNNSAYYYRTKGGGLIVTYNGETKIVNAKVGDMKSGSVYQRWHPTLPLIIFSNNTVRQAFPTLDRKKIEAFDFRADMLLYDVEKNSIEYVLRKKGQINTYPVWASDGSKIYFCQTDSAVVRDDSLRTRMKYKLMSMDFYGMEKPDTLKWGAPKEVYAPEGMSVSKPRVSPCGRYIAMTLSRYGAYHYTNIDSDVILYDLKEGKVVRSEHLNSPEAEGYVTWSSNGRWLMVGSRREDGNYVRLYFSYFDEEGNAFKSFQLPHKDPEFDKMLLKVYNYPEFSKVDTKMDEKSVYDMIEKNETVTPEFIGEIQKDDEVDANTGASVIK
jgi:hypothetical protein